MYHSYEAHQQWPYHLNVRGLPAFRFSFSVFLLPSFYLINNMQTKSIYKHFSLSNTTYNSFVFQFFMVDLLPFILIIHIFLLFKKLMFIYK